MMLSKLEVTGFTISPSQQPRTFLNPLKARPGIGIFKLLKPARQILGSSLETLNSKPAPANMGKHCKT